MYYTIFVSLCVIWCLMSLFETKILNKVNAFIMFTTLVLFAGFRYGVLWDYFNYQTIFESIIDWKDVLDPRIHIELGFRILIVLFQKIGLSWYGFVFFIAFLTLSLTFRFINKYSKNRTASLLLHLSPYFFINDMGAIRNGLSNAVLLNTFESIKEKKIIAFLTLVVLATSFHKSGILFVSAYILCNYFSISAKKVKLLGYLMFPILFTNQVINISYMMINLIYKLNISILNMYIDRYIESRFFYSEGISVNLLFQIAILIFAAHTFDMYCEDSDYKQNLMMLNIYFIGIATAVIFSNFDLIVGRFALIFLNFDKVLIVNSIYKHKKYKIPLVIMLIGYCIFRIYIYLRIHPVAHPYKTIWF